MLFGFIPPESRTNEQHEAHDRAMSAAECLPQFALEGTSTEEKGRFALWKPLMAVLGITDPKKLPWNWQVTGSCVGAGGDNCRKVTMAVEIMAGELEEWKHVWWPYTYGRSRFRAGMKTPGEGSFGSAWAEAATKDGCFSVDEANVPPFGIKDGWLQLSRGTELEWSDGDSQLVTQHSDVAALHLFGKYVQIRNSDEGKAAIVNGYAMTCASMFGTTGPRLVGEPAVYVAEWNDTWPHQMSLNEVWDHPSLGMLFRIQNQWGPTAHPQPTQGEPCGGFYITAKTFDRICGEKEVIAFSGLAGFKARKVDNYV